MFFSALMFYGFAATFSQFIPQRRGFKKHCEPREGLCHSDDDCCGQLVCDEGFCEFKENHYNLFEFDHLPQPEYWPRIEKGSNAMRTSRRSSCTQNFQRCLGSKSCCSGHCGWSFQCVPPKNEPGPCKNDGARCLEGKCCCSNYCHRDLICRPKECRSNGESCTFHDHCCSKFCSGKYHECRSKFVPVTPIPNPPRPKPTDPTPGPKPTDPTPGPKPTDPTPGPKPTDPTPGPKPTDPTLGPKPTDPTPGPKPTDPTPGPKPTNPTPGPKATDPTPGPPIIPEKSCKDAGDQCFQNSECCSKICGSNSRCQPLGAPGPPLSCSNDGDECIMGHQCCSGYCNPQYVCAKRIRLSNSRSNFQIPRISCTPDNATCVVSAQCCSAVCGWDFKCYPLGKRGASQCRRVGQRCDGDDDCCSGNCEQSTCEKNIEKRPPPVPQCNINGQQCDRDEDCCWNLICEQNMKQCVRYRFEIRQDFPYLN